MDAEPPPRPASPAHPPPPQINKYPGAEGQRRFSLPRTPELGVVRDTTNNGTLTRGSLSPEAGRLFVPFLVPDSSAPISTPVPCLSTRKGCVSTPAQRCGSCVCAREGQGLARRVSEHGLYPLPCPSGARAQGTCPQPGAVYRALLPRPPDR